MASLVLNITGNTAYSRTCGTGGISTTAETFTIPDHALVNGDAVRVTSSTTIPAGLVSGRIYYIVERTAGTFKLSLTVGGSAVNITSTGTGTHTVTKEVTEFSRVNKSSPKETIIALRNYCDALAGGYAAASIDLHTAPASPVAAATTVTLADVAADDTLVIGGVTLTAKASPSGEAQFSQAGSDTVDAASLVSIINAHSTLARVVIATSALGVVTLTCKVKGVIGNFIQVVATGGTMTAANATLVAGAGGPQGTATTYALGL